MPQGADNTMRRTPNGASTHIALRLCGEHLLGEYTESPLQWAFGRPPQGPEQKERYNERLTEATREDEPGHAFTNPLTQVMSSNEWLTFLKASQPEADLGDI